MYNKNFPEKEVILWEVLQINKEQEIEVRLISTNSQYKQGIRIAVDYGNGSLECNHQTAKGVELWEDTMQSPLRIKCKSEEGCLSIYNLFNLGNGPGGRRSQLASCGMLAEKVSDYVYRYHCNDVGFESDFSKEVFEIELL